jgi:hypothetical protein
MKLGVCKKEHRFMVFKSQTAEKNISNKQKQRERKLQEIMQ